MLILVVEALVELVLVVVFLVVSSVAVYFLAISGIVVGVVDSVDVAHAGEIFRASRGNSFEPALVPPDVFSLVVVVCIAKSLVYIAESVVVVGVASVHLPKMELLGLAYNRHIFSWGQVSSRFWKGLSG